MFSLQMKNKCLSSMNKESLNLNGVVKSNLLQLIAKRLPMEGTVYSLVQKIINYGNSMDSRGLNQIHQTKIHKTKTVTVIIEIKLIK